MAQKSPTTSTTSLRSEIQSEGQLSLRVRVYFQERLRQRLYDMVMTEFDAYEVRGGSKAKLARRLGKRPEQITRWLSTPGNLTFDTLSDLLLGLSGAELAMLLEYPASQAEKSPRLPEPLLQEKRNAEINAFPVGNNFSGTTSAASTISATLPLPNQHVYVELVT